MLTAFIQMNAIPTGKQLREWVDLIFHLRFTEQALKHFAAVYMYQPHE